MPKTTATPRSRKLRAIIWAPVEGAMAKCWMVVVQHLVSLGVGSECEAEKKWGGDAKTPLYLTPEGSGVYSPVRILYLIYGIVTPFRPTGLCSFGLMNGDVQLTWSGEASRVAQQRGR